MKVTACNNASMHGRSRYPQSHNPSLTADLTFSDGYVSQVSIWPDRPVPVLRKRQPADWRTKQRGETHTWEVNKAPSPVRVKAVQDWAKSDEFRQVWADLVAAEEEAERIADLREFRRKQWHLKRDAGPALFEALAAVLRHQNTPADKRDAAWHREGVKIAAQAERALAAGLGDGLFSWKVQRKGGNGVSTHVVRATDELTARRQVAYGMGGEMDPDLLEAVQEAEG